MSISMMSAPPSTPPPPPSGPPPESGGWTDEMIQQVAQDTGYSVDRVKADIARTGATSPEQLYPQLYSGAGIQPQGDGQMMSDGVVQGQPPAEAAAPPAAAPPETSEGEPPQSAPTEMAEGEGIDPRVAQAVHTAMDPRTRYKRTR